MPLVGLVAPDPVTIVAFGKAYCGRNRKGGRVPVMACRQKLQAVRRWFLSSSSARPSGAVGCDVGVNTRPAVSACHLTFDRNTNAGQRLVVTRGG